MNNSKTSSGIHGDEIALDRIVDADVMDIGTGLASDAGGVNRANADFKNGCTLTQQVSAAD